MLSVPLDHSGTVPGRLSLRVERRDGFAPGQHGVTLVLPERPGERFLPTDDFAWETDGRDLLRFEQRGTGAGALRCRDLEAATATDAGREAAACATLLGDRRAFFRTSDAVNDIEALRVELGVERLAIVGPGYGGYVAQRYAMRYPDHVEKLLLLSPVDAAGSTLCTAIRWPPCAGSSQRSAAAAVAASRATCSGTPRASSRSWLTSRSGGRSSGPPGTGAAASLTRQELLFTLLAGDDNFVLRPEYPAAVASALQGDPAPLLRQKRRAVAHRRALPPRLASPATHAATLCEEVRFPWSWHATPAERDAAAFSTETAMDPSLAAPFDPGTLVRSDLMRLCRRWPTASPSPPPDPGPMPDVPVLVLAGPDEGRVLARDCPPDGGALPDGKLLETPDQLVVLRLRPQRVCRQRGPALPRRAARAGPLPPCTGVGLAGHSGAGVAERSQGGARRSWSPRTAAAGL